MLKKRLIAVLLLKNGHLVKTRNFDNFQIIGSPLQSIERFNSWAVDEILLLDLSTEKFYDHERYDCGYENPDSIEGIISYLSRSCFVPLAVGGGIHNIEDIKQRLKFGADKVVINTQAFNAPGFIVEAAKMFGKQCIVVSIDVKFGSGGRPTVHVAHGNKDTGLDPVVWAKEVETFGAGEILLNSVDRDGTMSGYDLDLIRSVTENVDIPVIVCGGAGEWSHFVDAINLGQASAVGAANIFYFREQSTRIAKKYMKASGINVRFAEDFEKFINIKNNQATR
ncbi:MAG: imidazole glycerol phosphate synthase cyclase subunit [Candidatus Omnitrophota bacterium]